MVGWMKWLNWLVDGLSVCLDAGCGGIHRTLRFPSRLLISTSPSTHIPSSLSSVYKTRQAQSLSLRPSPSPASLPLRSQRRSPPPLPSLSPSSPSGNYHSLPSKPGWLHSRHRSGVSSAPLPSSTPAGDLSSSTKWILRFKGRANELFH